LYWLTNLKGNTQTFLSSRSIQMTTYLPTWNLTESVKIQVQETGSSSSINFYFYRWVGECIQVFITRLNQMAIHTSRTKWRLSVFLVAILHTAATEIWTALQQHPQHLSLLLSLLTACCSSWRQATSVLQAYCVLTTILTLTNNGTFRRSLNHNNH